MSDTKKDFFSKDYYFGKKNSNYINYNHWDNNQYWKSTIKQVKKFNLSGKILDVGCAFGFLLKRLKPYFDELCGIDISDFALERAKKEISDAKFNQVDLDNQEIPYPNNYFNLITAFDVLEHTKSIEVSLQKIKSKLKDDGILVISIPLKDNLFAKIFNFFDKDESHVSVPRKKELFDIIEKVGFKVIEKHYFFNMIFFKLKGIPIDVELVLQKK